MQTGDGVMSRAATQLAGNASSIFQAWLDLKQQSRHDTKRPATQASHSTGVRALPRPGTDR